MKKVLTVVGAAVAGVVAGVLLAPKSGRETREDLKRKAGEFKDEAARKSDQVREAAMDSVDSIKSAAKKVGGITEDTAKDVKSKAEKSTR